MSDENTFLNFQEGYNCNYIVTSITKLQSGFIIILCTAGNLDQKTISAQTISQTVIGESKM